MPVLTLFAFTTLVTYWTYQNAQKHQLAARKWALASAVTSGLSLPVYLAVRKPA